MGPIEFTPGHADDVPFLITDGDLVKQEEFSEEERLTSSHMVRFWTNFAKFGNPTPVSEDDEGSGLWYPVTPSQKNYMEINFEPKMKKNLNEDRMYFWEKMVWAEREWSIEKRQLYAKSTKYLLNLQ